MRNPYIVLGVGRGASDEEIKRSYRRLAKRLHPDLNPGKSAVEQQFREVNAAYEILADPAKRQRFDRGEIDADGKERGFAQGGARPGRNGAFSDFSIDEVFHEFLRRGRRGKRTGDQSSSTTQTLRLSFLEAALGAKRPVALADGRSVEVAIPAGIESGQTLRLRDAQAGETLLEITVEPHPLFTRKDRDILAEAPLPLLDSVLGGTITVSTIHGDVAVKVPKGSNSGSTLRLRGKGIEKGGTSGDHYVKLKLVLPDPPDPELTAALERWAQRQSPKIRGGAG
ncbi:MAG TPA: DnaJ C-terminal domain-containing protein [Stellaceae bacterium]|nr:DnaJ C-terminal domain-containing protein [Stellaceae bacterium]